VRPNLDGADLSKANLDVADLAQLHFTPKADKMPYIFGFAYAKNLDQTRIYPESLPILIELRKAFKRGFRDAERTMTYLIKLENEQKLENKLEEQRPDVKQSVELWFNRVLFNCTCGYGLYPGRCLLILFLLARLLSFVYLYSLRDPGRREVAGLWAVWLNDRITKLRARVSRFVLLSA